MKEIIGFEEKEIYGRKRISNYRNKKINKHFN